MNKPAEPNPHPQPTSWPELPVEHDRRGVPLPAKPRVGGIITPQ